MAVKCFLATVAECAMGPMSCPVCLSVCNVGVLWPNGWMDQDATWYGGKIVLGGDPALPTERGTAAAHFSARVVSAQVYVVKRSLISATADLLLLFL